MRVSSEGTETVVLAVAGEVDLGTAPSLEEAVTAAVESAGAKAVRIDLTEVSFMDSTGLRVLLSGRQHAEQLGVGFTVVNPRPHLLKVMRVTGIDGLLGVA